MKSLTIFWEAESDTDIFREAEGARYSDLPSIDVFRLVCGTETIFETRSNSGRLCFRRDVEIPSHRTRFKVGWIPGPAWVIDPEALDTQRVGVWMADGFHKEPCSCNPPHPINAFFPPIIREGNVA